MIPSYSFYKVNATLPLGHVNNKIANHRTVLYANIWKILKRNGKENELICIQLVCLHLINSSD